SKQGQTSATFTSHLRTMTIPIPTLWTSPHPQRNLKRTRSCDDTAVEQSLWSSLHTEVAEENGGRFVVPHAVENILTQTGWPWKRQKLQDPIGAHRTTSNPQSHDIERATSESNSFATNTTKAYSSAQSSAQSQSVQRFTIRISAGEKESVHAEYDGQRYGSINNVLSEAHQERELRRVRSVDRDDDGGAEDASWLTRANELLGSLHWERQGRTRG
ncbi:hypothetical protein BJ742DRAFT_819181, partial [Cladochytrium replicatum]